VSEWKSNSNYSLLNSRLCSENWWRRRQPHSIINQILIMLKAIYAPKDAPRSNRLNLQSDFGQFHRSSGARHASNCSSASVLQIRARARQSRSIVCSRSSSGKSCALRSASAKNASSPFVSDQSSMICAAFHCRPAGPSGRRNPSWGRHRSVTTGGFYAW
jgi:hypothetical protein